MVLQKNSIGPEVIPLVNFYRPFKLGTIYRADSLSNSPYKQSFKKPCEPKALWPQNLLYKSDFKLVFKLKRYVHLLGGKS